MHLITLSNLFPTPREPTRGLYNAQLFREMARHVAARGGQALNICLVPEWRTWKWATIRRWGPVEAASGCEGGIATRYLPVFYLPVVGRAVSWQFYYRALRTFFRESDVYGLSSNVSRPLLYASWLYPDGAAAGRLARELGLPYWLMALGSDTFHLRSPVRRRAVLRACDGASGVVCVADVLANRLAQAGVPRARLHVAPNGVDRTRFRPCRKDEAWSLLRQQTTDLGLSTIPSAPLILSVGNLVPVKGPDLLLEAFAMLRRPTSDGRDGDKAAGDNPHPGPLPQREREKIAAATSRPELVFIGSGPMRRDLECLARHLGIADAVHFLGRRPHAEVPLWMNVADLLCLSSRNEGMPNVVLEARACGLPVVTTPAGACPEVLLDRMCFEVTDSCTAADIAEGIRRILGRMPLSRTPDSAVPTWRQQADNIMASLWTSSS